MSSGSWTEVSDLICGPLGDRCIAALLNPATATDDVIGPMTSAGLMSEGRLTLRGLKCSDSAREYRDWIARGRELHNFKGATGIGVEWFRDKDVLEIGPGWGCNLVPIARVAKSVTGVELEQTYIEMSRILCRREGIAAPNIVRGSGDDLSAFPDASFDRVFIWTAIQFTDVSRTMMEVGRVLRPGGAMLTLQPVLATRAAARMSEWVRRPGLRPVKRALVDLTNTASYRFLNRRVVKDRSGFSTGRPVFLTVRYMQRLARQAGLAVCGDMTFRADSRVGLIFEKQ